MNTDLVSAFSMRQRLEAAAYRVVGIASDPATALRLAEQEAVHLALVSLELANETSGADIAQTLRRERGVPSLLIAAARAIPRPHHAGIVGYLLYPFSGPQLVDAVQAVGRHLAGAPAAALPPQLLLADG